MTRFLRCSLLVLSELWRFSCRPDGIRSESFYPDDTEFYCAEMNSIDSWLLGSWKFPEYNNTVHKLQIPIMNRCITLNTRIACYSIAHCEIDGVVEQNQRTYVVTFAVISSECRNESALCRDVTVPAYR